MGGPVHDLLVDRLDGPRWELALDLLRSGSGAVNLNGLVLSTDPATAAISRRLHVELECPFDPSLVNQAPHERLRVVAENDLGQARATIEEACSLDDRFSALVAGSGVVYEYVHRYGMGSLLVGTAGQTGDLSWR